MIPRKQDKRFGIQQRVGRMRREKEREREGKKKWRRKKGNE